MQVIIFSVHKTLKHLGLYGKRYSNFVLVCFTSTSSSRFTCWLYTACVSIQLR